MKIDKKLIKELTDYLNEFKLSELEYGDKEIKIKVSRNNPAVGQGNNISVLSSAIDKKNEEPEIIGKEVKSPIIGTAYLAPEPGGKKFVEVGKKIKKGDTIMIVEAMKTMNHVPSPVNGTVKKICVEDGSPVEFGQTIAIID
tara:strand:+ start:139 stop:564 length:426 start_codon:yes stop_codon:yes gene_type:complete